MNAALPKSDMPDFINTFRIRVAEDLNMLATLHDREPDSDLLAELKKIDFPFCLTLTSEKHSDSETMVLADAMFLLQQSLENLTVPVEQNILDDLAADYASIYLNHNISASPEESVWLDEDSLICQQSMFDVRTWYENYGLEIPNWRLRPDDHLVYELQFIAQLLYRDERLETLEKITVFMDEHLLRWLGNFGERVLGRCDTQYFAGVAALTAAYCEEFREILAEILEQPRPTREEIEERLKPKQSQAEEVSMNFMPGMGPAV
ncbi:MAG: molecular chaperone TorD family protein [Gammaproteobacteria bacterium]|nr:molecular chaperone TorD family protein [Gammaproteobacteria bacterium]